MKTSYTFTYQGSNISIYKAVAEKLNLPDRYRINSENEFWEILGENSKYGIEICKHAIEAEKNQN